MFKTQKTEENNPAYTKPLNFSMCADSSTNTIKLPQITILLFLEGGEGEGGEGGGGSS